MNSNKNDSHMETKRPYWQAQGLAEMVSQRFDRAVLAANKQEIIDAYFLVIHYYERTLMLLRSAFKKRKERLARAALSNLLILQSVLMRMHQNQPKHIPLAMPLTEALFDSYLRGLIVRVLDEATRRIDLVELSKRLKAFGLVRDLDPAAVQSEIDVLVQQKFVESSSKGLRRSKRPFFDLNIDHAMLASLLGEQLTNELRRAGFDGLSDVRDRRSEFTEEFTRISGMSVSVAALLVDVALAFQQEQRIAGTHYRFKNLLADQIPRAYQLEAFAVFRGNGYQNVVIEAPTGSGKTLIGMLCIQDWLQNMVAGQSVLVVVPTINYQQQWLRELSFNRKGLNLSPEFVFAGTPTELMRYMHRQAKIPSVAVVTYTALAQLSSVNGQFEHERFRQFISDHGVVHVVLDEVHKAVADKRSPTARVVAALVDANRQDFIADLIGFSGTASIYRERLKSIGLRLAHTVPLTGLIASGYIAPFAEFGIPFGYSAREHEIRRLIDAYKQLMREFIDLLDSDQMRKNFASLPLQQRVLAAIRVVGLYKGRPDATAASEIRLSGWEQGGRLTILELPLISILQTLTARADIDLVTPEKRTEFEDLLVRANGIRETLKAYWPQTEQADFFCVPDFGKFIASEQLQGLLQNNTAAIVTAERSRLLLAGTLSGFYAVIAGWYRRMGEGRVAAINAIVAAEGQARSISKVIVFDRSRRLRWQKGITRPGFDGVAGLFAESLGYPELTPLAALSNEIYLPWSEDKTLLKQIAEFISEKAMLGYIGNAMHDLLAAGLEWQPQMAVNFRQRLRQLLRIHAEKIGTEAKPRINDFRIEVLRPLRQEFGHRQKGLPPESARRLRDRLNLKNPNLRSMLTSFCDYAALCFMWCNPRSGKLYRSNGQRERFFVIPMPSGRLKLLMYDLISRLVDAPSIQINMFVVSDWARTGWNVTQPNVLIDATATRDVTAWQQLRGRAMRALPSWSTGCYRLITLLLNGPEIGKKFHEQAFSEDVGKLFQQMHQLLDESISEDENVLEVLMSILNDDQQQRFREHGLAVFSAEERFTLAIRLIRSYNKVTHVYELLKASGTSMHIRYDRVNRCWKRSDFIATKHAHELGVDPQTATVVSGERHAPVIYHEDPRLDSPLTLQSRIGEHLNGLDTTIIKAWLAGSSFSAKSVSDP